jgi:hypothetical protein
VDAVAGERVQVERHGCDERLSLARLHLGDVALVEDDRAHHLDVEVALAERTLRRLADSCVRLEEQILQRLAIVETLAELGRLGRKVCVRQALEVRLERADVLSLRPHALEATAFADAKDLLEASEIRHAIQGIGSVPDSQ